MNRVPDATLSLPIHGLNLTGETLAAEIDALPGEFTLIAFLRHYGCMFGREMVRDIRWATKAVAGFPTPLFVGLGDNEETRDYMKPTWPEAPIICDPERVLFNAFELGKGSAMQMFGPSVWACHLRASFKGNFFGKIVGDPWIMPGIFVMDRSRAIRYKHEFRHQGDHPVWSKLPSLISPAAELPRVGAALV
jgi:hypothetical protein